MRDCVPAFMTTVAGFISSGSSGKTGDFPVVALAPGFTAWLCTAHSPALTVFRGLPSGGIAVSCAESSLGAR